MSAVFGYSLIFSEYDPGRIKIYFIVVTNASASMACVIVVYGLPIVPLPPAGANADTYLIYDPGTANDSVPELIDSTDLSTAVPVIGYVALLTINELAVDGKLVNAREPELAVSTVPSTAVPVIGYVVPDIFSELAVGLTNDTELEPIDNTLPLVAAPVIGYSVPETINELAVADGLANDTEPELAVNTVPLENDPVIGYEFPDTVSKLAETIFVGSDKFLFLKET